MSCSDKRARINCESISSRRRKEILLKGDVAKSPGGQRGDTRFSQCVCLGSMVCCLCAGKQGR